MCHYGTLRDMFTSPGVIGSWRKAVLNEVPTGLNALSAGACLKWVHVRVLRKCDARILMSPSEFRRCSQCRRCCGGSFRKDSLVTRRIRMATNKSNESIDDKAFQALEDALKIDFDELKSALNDKTSLD